MNDIIYVGIDPGLTGALAMLSGTGQLIELYDFETIEIKKSTGRKSNVLNVANLNEYLKLWILNNPGVRLFATIELQQPYPGARSKGPVPVCPACGKQKSEGVVSVFRSGVTFGEIKTVVNVARSIPIVFAAASAWKSKFDLRGRDKDLSRNRVIELWPDRANLFKRKLDHNRAEAALIGLYGIKYKWAAYLADVSRETGGGNAP